jgi:hypothetical protein
MTNLDEQLAERERQRTLARASAPQAALAEAVDAGKVSMSAILAALGFDPNRPEHQAALLTCERYGLDPLMKHVVVIKGSGAYITRDGRLHVAHRSGKFDGMSVDAQGDTGAHWFATVSVYRKDMSHPFTFTGRYPKDGQNKVFGPEMAVKVAECAALRRAFDVGLPSYEERWDVADEPTRATTRPGALAPGPWAEVELPLDGEPDDTADPDTEP